MIPYEVLAKCLIINFHSINSCCVSFKSRNRRGHVHLQKSHLTTRYYQVSADLPAYWKFSFFYNSSKLVCFGNVWIIKWSNQSYIHPTFSGGEKGPLSGPHVKLRLVSIHYRLFFYLLEPSVDYWPCSSMHKSKAYCFITYRPYS